MGHRRGMGDYGVSKRRLDSLKMSKFAWKFIHAHIMVDDGGGRENDGKARKNRGREKSGRETKKGLAKGRARGIVKGSLMVLGS